LRTYGVPEAIRAGLNQTSFLIKTAASCKPPYFLSSINMSLSKEQQFLKLYDELSEAIFRHCYFRIFNRETAKDLMQEAFKKTWEYLTDGGKIDSPKAFLYRVANNLVIDRSRKKESLSLDDLREAGFDPGADGRSKIENMVDGRALMNVLEKFDSADRQLILMRYIDDLTPKEMAAILNENENLISVRLHRALKKVREILNENHE